MDLNISEGYLKDSDLNMYVKFKSWELDKDFKYFIFDHSNYIELNSLSKIIWSKESQDFKASVDIEEGFADCLDLDISSGVVKYSRKIEEYLSDYMLEYLEDTPLEEGRYFLQGTCYFDWDNLEVEFEITKIEEE